MSVKKPIGSDFDFSEAIAFFARFVDPEHPQYDAESIEAPLALLTTPQFGEFAAHYFALDQFWPELQEYQYHQKNELRSSTDFREIKLYKQFASTNFPHRNKSNALFLHSGEDDAYQQKLPPKGAKVRKQEVYPLSADETELSIDFIHRNSDYEFTMMAIKMCIIDYLDRLKEAIAGAFDFDMTQSYKCSVSQNKLTSAHNALLVNAVDFSFLQDLMPIIANTIRQQDDAFSDESIHSSFQNAFARHAFKSVSENRGFKRCPFAISLTDLMRVRLDSNDNGGLNAVQTQTPGALILSVRNHIRSNFLQALPPDHDVYDRMENHIYNA